MAVDELPDPITALSAVLAEVGGVEAITIVRFAEVPASSPGLVDWVERLRASIAEGRR